MTVLTEPSVQSEGGNPILNPLDFEDDGEDESDGGWQQELQRRYAQEANFMAELRARQQGGPWDAPQGGQQQGYVGQGEEYVEKIQGNGDLTLGPFAVQDPQENSGNEQIQNEMKNKETLEWEEALKHWVNR